MLEVINKRLDRIRFINSNPDSIPLLKSFYRSNPIKFINDWGMTFDPRLVSSNTPAVIPFILYKRQIEWLEWVIERYEKQQPGLTEKSRDMGLSWLAISFACTLCIFNKGVVIGFGSRKEDYVDKNGDPKSLFWKAKFFLDHLPKDLICNWSSSHLRIQFATGSYLTGEAGDNIGRGDRTSIYFVDESCYIERPNLIDASLSATTNCRIDISSVNGMGNSFAQKRFSWPIDRVFTFHWRDDPRKDDQWYQKQKLELPSVVIAQEIDINYQGSVEGLIPAEWITAAIDAHKKLKIPANGLRVAALDVADQGRDLNAFVIRTGFVIEYIETWKGEHSDIFETVSKVFRLCEMNKVDKFLYDADGLGAGVRGDARAISKEWNKNIIAIPFRGSAEISLPFKEVVPGRSNGDFFENFKAQCWWRLRTLFQNTYRFVVEKKPYTEIISIAHHKDIGIIAAELAQPTITFSKRGKIMIDKTPDNMRSPNIADSIMMSFAYELSQRPINISEKGLRTV